MAQKRDAVLTVFGKRLAALRKARDWTQERLAEEAGLGPQYVSECERGVANPTLKTLHDLAAALDLSLPHLIADPSDVEHELTVVLEARSSAERQQAMRTVKAMFER